MQAFIHQNKDRFLSQHLAMSQQQQLEAATFMQRTGVGRQHAFTPYLPQFMMMMPSLPPPDDQGMAIGLPVRAPPRLFQQHRTEQRALFNSPALTHGPCPLETKAKPMVSHKYRLAETGGRHTPPVCKGAKRDTSSSSTAHSTFMLGARSPHSAAVNGDPLSVMQQQLPQWTDQASMLHKSPYGQAQQSCLRVQERILQALMKAFQGEHEPVTSGNHGGLDRRPVMSHLSTVLLLALWSQARGQDAHQLPPQPSLILLPICLFWPTRLPCSLPWSERILTHSKLTIWSGTQKHMEI